MIVRTAKLLHTLLDTGELGAKTLQGHVGVSSDARPCVFGRSHFGVLSHPQEGHI